MRAHSIDIVKNAATAATMLLRVRTTTYNKL